MKRELFNKIYTILLLCLFFSSFAVAQERDPANLSQIEKKEIQAALEKDTDLNIKKPSEIEALLQ